jgi:hypothetical protein
MIKGVFESPVSLSVGIVMRMKVHNKSGAVRYEILYKDQSGREHTRWSDWMRFDGYQIGDSIPVKVLTIPATFSLISDLLEVDGHPQNHVEPYVLAMVATGVVALFTGYRIGKDKK